MRRILLALAPLIGALCACAPEDPPTAAAASVTESEVAATQAAAHPNIILIVADDLGVGDVGVYGSTIIETPEIDALAADGVRLTEGYVTHPVCSPSRAGLMTGRYQQRHGWEFNPAHRDDGTGMSAEEQTIADSLSALGYDTAMIGKWHLGYRAPFHPLDRGFDEYFGVLAGGSIFIDPQAPGVETVSSVVPVPRKRPARIAVYEGREPVEVTEYLTDVFTRRAVDFVRRDREGPFFLYLSHTTPHTPLQATAEYVNRYRHIEDPGKRVYAAMVASLDDSVGAVRDALRETGQLDNTLIAFISDNGCAGYINGACSNAPFAGFKRYHQEGGIRIPFIFSWPDHLPAGTERTAMASTVDLLATFTAAAGQQAHTEDSENLLPWLAAEADQSVHDYLYWRSGPTIAIRDARWKLIRYNRTNFTRADLNATGRLDPPADGWPTDSPHGQITLLYDLEADPSESTNVAAQHPEVVQRLQAAHAQWAAELTAQTIQPAIRSTLTEVHGETVQLVF